MRSVQAAALAAVLGVGVATAQPVKLNMPSAFPGDLVQLGAAGIRLQDTVNTISGGEVEIRFFEPGALVQPAEIFDAVASGAVEAGWTVAGHWSDRNPAFVLFGAQPFGPSPADLLGWMERGGGADLMNDVLAADGVLALPCGLTAPEGGGWYREEITSPEALDGLSLRFYGPGAKVMRKLGAKTRLLAGGEIFPALEAGEIDGTEFSMPAIDQALGFHAIAPHGYFPGWHQGWGLQMLLLNRAKWQSMNAMQQAVLQTACRANAAEGLAEGATIQEGALSAMEAGGAILHRWPPEMIEAFRIAWGQVVAEESAASPDFARVWDSLSAFRDAQARWKSLSRLD